MDKFDFDKFHWQIMGRGEVCICELPLFWDMLCCYNHMPSLCQLSKNAGSNTYSRPSCWSYIHRISNGNLIQQDLTPE